MRQQLVRQVSGVVVDWSRQQELEQDLGVGNGSRSSQEFTANRLDDLTVMNRVT